MSKFNTDMLAVIRCGDQFRNEQVAPYGLRACHIGYLSRICYCPGISQDRLAQWIFVNKSNVARQAAVLEKNGFITRTPSPADKRVLELHPTEKALELLPTLRQIVDQWDALLTEGLTEEELEAFSGVMAKMKEKAAAWSQEH